MNKKIVAIVVLGGTILVALGFYIGLHNARSTSPSRAQSTIVTKKTTYQATVGNAVFATKSSGSLGQYLATPKGQPLYTYSKDAKGASNCAGNCLTAWPPYKDTTTADTSLPLNVSTLTRSDNGMVQYTYKGMPLYTYTHDTGGKVAGNGVNNFKLARL